MEHLGNAINEARSGGAAVMMRVTRPSETLPWRIELFARHKMVRRIDGFELPEGPTALDEAHRKFVRSLSEASKFLSRWYVRNKGPTMTVGMATVSGKSGIIHFVPPNSERCSYFVTMCEGAMLEFLSSARENSVVWNTLVKAAGKNNEFVALLKKAYGGRRIE